MVSWIFQVKPLPLKPLISVVSDLRIPLIVAIWRAVSPLKFLWFISSAVHLRAICLDNSSFELKIANWRGEFPNFDSPTARTCWCWSISSKSKPEFIEKYCDYYFITFDNIFGLFWNSYVKCVHSRIINANKFLIEWAKYRIYQSENCIQTSCIISYNSRMESRSSLKKRKNCPGLDIPDLCE